MHANQSAVITLALEFPTATYRKANEFSAYPATGFSLKEWDPWVNSVLRRRTAHVGEMPMGEFACQPLHRSYNGTCDPFIFHALGQNTKQQLLGKARATLAAATSMQPPPPPPMLALPQA